ncbi:MAG: hypothetical protein ACIARR_01070 [Phycisphaerales bacterium JB059]
MRPCQTAAAAALAVIAPLATAGTTTTFDFESLVHGEIVTNQFAPLMTVSALNPNRPFDIAAAFDTSLMGTADPDLEGPPWAGGNLAISDTETQLGRALIIAENNTGAGDGILDNPDDEGSRPAGQLIFDFASKVSLFGFDVVDIEGNVMEYSRLEFFSGGDSIATVGFDEFTNNASSFYDATVVFGDNTANRISPITADALVDAGFSDARSGFDRVIIHAGGSSAYDNIVIPAPSGLLALAGGWLILAPTRRRR